MSDSQYSSIYRVGVIFYFVRYDGAIEVSCTHTGYGKGLCIACFKNGKVSCETEDDIKDAVKRFDGEKLK